MLRPQFVAGSLAVALLAAGCQRATPDEPAPGAVEGVRDIADLAASRLNDSWLTTRIQAQFFVDDDVKGRYVTVTTQDGIVTLTGRVDNRGAREQALDIARSTDGVKDVRDQLVVGPLDARGGRTEQADSGWITTQIQARFFADSDIGHRNINVSTSDGVVTLSGTVENALEEQQALAIAHDIEGVTRVEDRITVTRSSGGSVGTSGPSTGTAAGLQDDDRITTAIQAKYFLDNSLKSRDLDVAVSQGVVTLSGEVNSEDERAQALLLAQTTEGVERVEDALSVNIELRN